MPQVSESEWKQFLAAHPEAHFLQSAEWGKLKSAFGWQAEHLIAGGAGAQILFRKLPLGFTVGYIPKGPVLGEQAPDQEFWQAVDSLCTRRRAILLKIEPDGLEGEERPLGFPPGMQFKGSPAIQPRRTILVNLQDTEENILARMKQKTRYNIHLAEKKGVTIRAWEDLQAFHQMLRVTGGRDGFGVHAPGYYQQAYDLFHPAGMCELLVAEYQSRPLAALMVFARGPRAWYVYGASSDEERNRMPTYLLQWQAMLWAKARGCMEYDLWGVPDEDEARLEAGFEARQDGLWGVYRFKRGFGGGLRRAVGAMDRVYVPLLYKAYSWRMAGREAG